jgi:hypothetical protein
METDEAARHFARAMVSAGREPSFVFEVMAAYYGDVGQEAAIAAFEEAEGNRGDSEGVDPSQTP